MTDPNQLQRINLLAQKWQKGTITPNEKAEFEQWYTLFDDVFEVNTAETREEAEARIYKTILSKGGIHVNPKRNLARIFVAASIVLALSVGGYFLLNKQDNQQLSRQADQSVYLSPAGKRKSLTLSDGTVVLLNAGSKLTVLPGYNHQKREVLLEGEGYFTVVHNSKSPFSVHTVNFDVNDLGTIFNVKAYASDKTSEAVLIKGSVEVVIKNRAANQKNNVANRIVLSPNKKLVILNDPLTDELVVKDNNRTSHYKVTGIGNNVFKNSIVETDWTNNKLTFYDQKFDDIVPIIERWYNVKLIVHNKQLSGYNFTATFTKQSIDEVLMALKLTANFSYRKEGDEIIIY
jgi:transmembrane sensor